jgi:hypothetical protein
MDSGPGTCAPSRNDDPLDVSDQEYVRVRI